MTQITLPRETVQQAFDYIDSVPDDRYNAEHIDHEALVAALRTALEAPAAQKVEPSNTRYTVAVEGQALTYWDNVHDAITTAQRAVYSGPENTTRALDDLKAGRFAEWSYGFSAVRIYPPQAKQAAPVSTQWLAEMIMSDCGCSTNNQRLLDRIINRIDQYERANAAPAAQWEMSEPTIAPSTLVSPLDAFGPLFSEKQMHEAWKAGYKHGAWSDAPAAREPLSAAQIRNLPLRYPVGFGVALLVARATEAAHGIGRDEKL